MADDHNMTSSYSMVKTHEALAKFRDMGYLVRDAGQDKARKRNPLHVRHLLHLVHSDYVESDMEYVPQILFINSHNGRTKCRLFAGFYRFVCANGLIIGNEFSRIEIAHRGELELEAAMNKLSDEAHKTQKVIGKWSKKKLSREEQMEFAREAIEARYGEGESQVFLPEKYIKSEREEDEGDTLWLTFNRVQEKLMNGGVQGLRKMPDGTEKRTTARAITEIYRKTEVNQFLWQAAEKLAA